MSPVGGSRHYTGGGLGNEAGWKCPGCGAENQGPISQGCALCGAGKPGHRADAALEPPEQGRSDDPAEAWLQAHPNASVREAFLAGYQAGRGDGLREARMAQEQFPPAQKVNRTLLAALTLFRDQILTGEPEEMETGEWCTVEEVNQLLAQLQEAVHA